MKSLLRSFFNRLSSSLSALDPSIRSALFVFALSRAIILVIFILVPHVQLRNTRTSVDEGQDVSLTLEKVSPARTLRPLATWGDSGWYLGIARYGYEQEPFNVGQHNWAFFPLYPLTLRAAAKITGGYEVTGMALSSIFLLFALVILHKLVLSDKGDQATADRAIFYLAFFPTSYFFSLPHTESLFLLVTVGSFYAARRERWWLAGILGALASATRFIGILMLPTLLLLYWQQHRRWPRLKELGFLLAPAGLLCYMLYLRSITGNALAFKDTLAAWNRSGGFFLTPIINYLKHPAEIAPPVGGGNFFLLHIAAVLTVIFCAYKLARAKDWALSFYALASALIPLSSQNLVSNTRYMMTVFPMYLILARAGESMRLDHIIRSIFLVLLTILTALFAIHFTIAFT